MSGVKGMKHRRPRQQGHKDAIAASRIEQILDDQYDPEKRGKEGHKLSQAALKALEIRYSRLRPTLAAVEQTHVDERDKSDPTVVMTSLVSRLMQKPELVTKILAETPALQETFRSALATIAAQQEHNEGVLVDAPTKH